MNSLLGTPLLVLAVIATGCGTSSAGAGASPAKAEKAVRAAFGANVHCVLTASTLPGQFAVGGYRCHSARGHGHSAHAGCVMSTDAGGSTEYFSCFGPHSPGRCVVHRGGRFVVAPEPSAEDGRGTPCPYHVIREPVAIGGAVLRVTDWMLGVDPPCPYTAGLGDPCYPHFYVAAGLVFCAHGRAWSVGATDFTLETANGQSFTGSDVAAWQTLIRRRVRPGQCLVTKIAFGPVDDAFFKSDTAFNSANPPTIAFHQPGTPTVDWIAVARPYFRATHIWSP